jgi:hypothetical protein
LSNHFWYERELNATVEFTDHARKRQVERSIQYKDIVETLKRGYQRPGSNRFEYKKLVVAAKKSRAKFVVITVFEPEEAA